MAVIKILMLLPMPEQVRLGENLVRVKASQATSSGSPATPPGWGGAGRPEKRVTARSKLPQKKWTRLALARKPVRKSLKMRSACTSAPEAMSGGGVIGGVVRSSEKRIGSGTSFGVLLDRDRNAHPAEEIDGRAIKIGDRLRTERQESFGAAAGSHIEPMGDEIELDLEYLGAMGDRRSG